ncbi:hypothetical protein E2C01_084592 [Portunus trituberculatus]|uniref:Uncharacterized protein n=1 Tax=Portunus trituberculatus TaxID=210409 RepID=A0A5B7J9P8_PORTR|nr:hypothetical protein [Portunus trituberculatus]
MFPLILFHFFNSISSTWLKIPSSNTRRLFPSSFLLHCLTLHFFQSSTRHRQLHTRHLSSSRACRPHPHASRLLITSRTQICGTFASLSLIPEKGIKRPTHPLELR